MSKVNKSQIVRDQFIAPAKAAGLTWRDIIQDVMTHMGMDRATARSYLVNCWERKGRGDRAAKTPAVTIPQMFQLPTVPLLTYTPTLRMTLEEALEQIPLRNDRGHFIKRDRRIEMAQELMAAA